MSLSARGSALEVFLLEDRSSQQRRHESMYVQIFMCFVLHMRPSMLLGFLHMRPSQRLVRVVDFPKARVFHV